MYLNEQGENELDIGEVIIWFDDHQSLWIVEYLDIFDEQGYVDYENTAFRECTTIKQALIQARVQSGHLAEQLLPLELDKKVIIRVHFLDPETAQFSDITADEDAVMVLLRHS
jgi:hypothetical protein